MFSDQPPASASWRALGTTAHVLVTDPSRLALARRAVERELAAIDSAASRFRTDSELSRLNNGDGGWQTISPLFAHALRVAIDACTWTGGLVDPTVGRSLLELGYNQTFTTVPKTGPAVTVELRPAPGIGNLELDDNPVGGEGAVGPRARLRPGIVVDLGATAKALASDRAAYAASAAAGCAVLVNLGGDIACAGAPLEEGWAVYVTDDSATPPDEGRDGRAEGQTIILNGGGLTTSGIRARRWQRGGSEIHHLIDPRSGGPTQGPWRTVSVAAPTCVLANTASTTSMVMGSDAPSWLEQRQLAARLVNHDGGVTVTAGWPVDHRDPERASHRLSV